MGVTYKELKDFLEGQIVSLEVAEATLKKLVVSFIEKPPNIKRMLAEAKEQLENVDLRFREEYPKVQNPILNDTLMYCYHMNEGFLTRIDKIPMVAFRKPVSALFIDIALDADILNALIKWATDRKNMFGG